MARAMLLENVFAKHLSRSGKLSDAEIEKILNKFSPICSQCLFCNGFYGSNHNQPLCSTCHELTCPALESSEEFIRKSLWTDGGGKSDSEDSGNEDSGPDPAELPAAVGRRNSDSNQQRIGPVKDLLYERIQALSIFNPASNRICEGWIETHLPPEVLTRIFGFLDDVALWCCTKVCRRWNKVIKSETTARQWEHFVRRRWPLFQPFIQPVCWFKTYGKLVETVPCMTCLQRSYLDASAITRPVNGVNMDQEERYCGRRLASELRLFQTDPPEGIEAVPLNTKRSKWVASLTGPTGSPYEGGKFILSVEIPVNYPLRPPSIRFLTKIFHPNVSRHGEVGLDILNHQWIPALTIAKLVLCVQSILTDPNPDGCMEEEIGQLYRENRGIYNSLAQMWTWKYAMVDLNLGGEI